MGEPTCGFPVKVKVEDLSTLDAWNETDSREDQTTDTGRQLDIKRESPCEETCSVGPTQFDNRTNSRNDQTTDTGGQQGIIKKESPCEETCSVGSTSTQSDNRTDSREDQTTDMGSQHTEDQPYNCSLYDYYSTAQKGTVIQHMHAKLTSKKQYVCGECGMTTAYKSSLTLHMRRHTGEKPYICYECGFETSRKGNLDDHMLVHTGEKPYMCKVCGFRTASRSHLYVHARKHTGEKPYKCDQCDFSATGKSRLERHKRKHVPWEERQYVCDRCGYRTAFKEHLVVHRKSYWCSVALREFEEEEERERVLNKQSSGSPDQETPSSSHPGNEKKIRKEGQTTPTERHQEKDEENSGVNSSSIDKKPVSHPDLQDSTELMDMDKHVDSNDFESPIYVCDECGYSTSSQGHLSRHMRRHSKSYKCDQCDFISKGKGTFDLHMRKHKIEESASKAKQARKRKRRSGKKLVKKTSDKHLIRDSVAVEKPFKWVVRKNLLESAQIAEHTGQKPSNFEQSNCCSVQKNSLKPHMAERACEKALEYDQSNCSDMQINSLEPHMANHPGEKAVTCEQSDCSAMQVNSPESHVASHSGVELHMCGKCGYTAADGSDLSKHMCISCVVQYV